MVIIDIGSLVVEKPPHRLFSKTDGLINLLSVKEKRGINDIGIEFFSILELTELEDVIMNPQRDYPLLVRTDAYLHEVTKLQREEQPRKKFTSAMNCDNKTLYEEYTKFINSCKKYEQRHGFSLYALSLHLPKKNYEAIGNVQFSHETNMGEICITLFDSPSEKSTTFRKVELHKSIDYFEKLVDGQHIILVDRLPKKFKQSINHVRAITDVLLKEYNTGFTELSFTLYQGEETPIAYDWLRKLSADRVG